MADDDNICVSTAAATAATQIVLFTAYVSDWPTNFNSKKTTCI